MLNKSIFSLVENPQDLPSSNENMADLFYREILPTRDLTDSATVNSLKKNFAGSNISIRWNMDNQTWWLPSRSYLKFDMVFQKPGDENTADALVITDQIAPNMGTAACMMNKLHFKMNDQTICQISQHIPQCDAIANRVFHSDEWLNKNAGNDTNFWASSQIKRAHEISSNGNISDYVYKTTSSLDDNYLDRYIVLNKSQLLLNDIAIEYDNATNEVLFTLLAGGLFNAQNQFKKGDIIFLQFDENLPTSRQRVWYVSNTFSPVRIDIIVTDQVNGGAGTLGNQVASDYTLTLLRHRDPIRAFEKKQLWERGLLGGDVNYVNGTGVLTLDAQGHGWSHASIGDLLGHQLSVGDLDTMLVGTWNFREGDATSGNYITYPSHTLPVLGVGDRGVGYIQYSEYYQFTDANQLGFDSVPVLGASHAWQMEAVDGANGEGMRLRIARNNSIIPLPNIDVFQTGDIVYLRQQAVPALGIAYIIFEQLRDISDINNLWYRIALSKFAAANFGNVADGRNHIKGRSRYLPHTPMETANKIDANIGQIKMTRRKSKFDVLWKPSCLSIFNYPGAIPGGCKFELELQAISSKYAPLAIETPPDVLKTVRAGGLIGVADAVQVLVKNVKLYICQTQGPIVGSGEYTYYLNLNEIRAHNQVLTSSSLTQTTVDVMPSSYALAIAFQDQRAENASRTDLSISKLKLEKGKELAITRYSIRFAGLSLPQPDAEIKVSESEEMLINNYLRNQIYTNQYYKTTGGESLHDWKERGIYFYHPFVRSAGNREARAYIITQFNSNPNAPTTEITLTQGDVSAGNVRLFIFEFYRAFAMIKMRNGFVYDIKTANQ